VQDAGDDWCDPGQSLCPDSIHAYSGGTVKYAPASNGVAAFATVTKAYVGKPGVSASATAANAALPIMPAVTEGITSLWNTVAFGDKSGLDSNFAAGLLNMAPMGLGMLATANYLSDTRLFYCPSASGMKSTYSRSSNANNTTYYGGWSLGHWQQAGGFSGDVLQYGDWSKAPNISGQHMIFSNYAYRGAPLTLYIPWHSREDGRNAAMRLTGVKPDLIPRAGQPYFRTFRELGGRALVADVFGKGGTNDAMGVRRNDMWNYDQSAGYFSFALQAHRNMFNVLYGDGHTAGFGDPQETIAWHKQIEGQYRHSIGCNFYYGYQSADSSHRGPFGRSLSDNHPRYSSSGPAIWHEFDLANRMDVEAN
ncbi:MAG TPA: hypothetical protein P5137_17475, partial [Candidatus Brocadiia bacterium]|nr:hypothetical protein [Candidatus Brocadiia bacterium]